MSYLSKIGLSVLCLFLFQNCTSFKGKSLSVYSYTTIPDFFYDLKLVSVEIDPENRELYVFDMAITYAKKTDQDVTYQVLFSVINFPNVCSPIDGTANGADKHIRFQCLLPTQNDLHLKLTLLGPSGEEVVEQYKF